MNEIVFREDLSDSTFRIDVSHPMLARAAKPGQFVIVRIHERGERIPLTIADSDRDQGFITLVIQAVGKSTMEMQRLCLNGFLIANMVGPMGEPSHIRHDAKKIVLVGGGLGVAPIYPQLRAYADTDAYVIAIVGFRSKDLVFWQQRYADLSDELIICTDDGSLGIHGRVTDGIEAMAAKHQDIDELIAIGPPVMMRACCDVTRRHGIKTTVSLNPLMVDGTGMCGGCRVSVGGKIKFGCVDGPEFDGHQVDFDELINRLSRFKNDETEALERWNRNIENCKQISDPSGI